jgi:hypothetical protein
MVKVQVPSADMMRSFSRESGKPLFDFRRDCQTRV